MPNLAVKLHHRHVCVGKNSPYRVQRYPWFQASTGGIGTPPPWIGGDQCITYLGWLGTAGSRRQVYKNTLIRQNILIAQFPGASEGQWWKQGFVGNVQGCWVHPFLLISLLLDRAQRKQPFISTFGHCSRHREIAWNKTDKLLALQELTFWWKSSLILLSSSVSQTEFVSLTQNSVHERDVVAHPDFSQRIWFCQVHC